jgi:small subunit ribosomal protein S1
MNVLEAGDKVMAVSPDDEERYPGRLKEKNGDAWVVAWDDPDGGPETHEVAEDNIKKMYFFTDYTVGDDCRAISPDDERWYPGTVAEILGDNKFRVKWDDPDEGDPTADLHFESMKRVKVKRDYKEGDEVLAAYPEDGTMYEAKVVKQNDDGTFTVKWDDPDGGPETSDINPKSMKVPPIPFADLKVGDKYEGTVVRVGPSWGIVDIGSERGGFLHISKVAKERVENIADYIEEDQQVTVWISGVSDDGTEKFSLTMVEGMKDPIRRPPNDIDAFSQLSSDDWYDAVVDRVAPFGAFCWVELESGAGAQGLLHVSQIDPDGGRVENPEDWVKVGETVKVRVNRVEVDSGKISLSRREGGGGGGAPREPQDFSPFEGADPSTWFEGKVTGTLNFGVFVQVQAPGSDASAKGMVHCSQIRDGFVENPADEVEIGQEVKVRVVSVDAAQGRMSLSMRPEEGSEE